MTTEKVITTLLDALNELQVPYMLVGSYSSNFYGVTRSTKDADIVVNLSAGTSIISVAKKMGPSFLLDPQTFFETITSTTKYVITSTETPFTIEVFLLSSDPHDQERFRRRRQVRLMDRVAYVPTVEDVIVMKLRWAASRGKREGKDASDVANVIAVSGDIIDWSYVYSWSDQHGTRGLLETIRASIPPL